MNILYFNFDILTFDTEIVLIFWYFIFYIWHWHFVDKLIFWHFDITFLKLWHWHWHWHFSTTLSQYHWWILRLSAIQKKSTDSAVIYHGFCDYLSWILWLSVIDSVFIWHQHLRDASASKNTLYIARMQLTPQKSNFSFHIRQFWQIWK